MNSSASSIPAQPSPGAGPETDLVELAERIRGGDEAAATELVERFRRGLTLVLRRRCGDVETAEDLVQETFLLVLEKIRQDALEAPERLAGFIHGTARNLLLANRRREGRLSAFGDGASAEAGPRPVEPVAEPGPGPFDTLLRREESRLVRELLAEMPYPRDRQVLIRFYLSQQPKESLCAELGIEPGHFRRVLYRARERLREQWARFEKRSRLERETAR